MKIERGKERARYTLTVDILSGSAISTLLRNVLPGSENVNTKRFPSLPQDTSSAHFEEVFHQHTCILK